MHSEAEFGIASHYVYKKSNEDSSWSSDLINLLLRVSGKNKNTTTPDWIQEIAESQKSENLQSNQQFMSELRDDFFTSRIFAFTPNGDVIDLPSGATPIDFAYYIHTNIGDHISGAKINGKLSNLGTELRNGDIVEIITSKKSKPSQKWLSMTATSFAKRRIRNSLQKEDQTEKLDNP
jgi:GTP pyrophosphokinase